MTITINEQLTWKKSSQNKYEWVQKFKDVFIFQKRNSLDILFTENFGYHNGFTLAEYAQYEFDEFELKCFQLGLYPECEVQCFDLGENYFYFCLGKKEDKAVFESIFRWDELEQKAYGNGYRFKIEPKVQFIKNHQTSDIEYKRRINLTPPSHNTFIKNVVVSSPADNFQLIKTEVESNLGGNFYSLIFNHEQEQANSYWDRLRIFTNDGVFKCPVLMRGTDHPLFVPDLFPIVTEHTVSCPQRVSNLYLLYVLLDNGEEFYYKYPTQDFWTYEQKIKKVCITDTLSFDWIVELKK